jgi:ArsR family metal-binding transcriptional regulator
MFDGKMDMADASDNSDRLDEIKDEVKDILAEAVLSGDINTDDGDDTNIDLSDVNVTIDEEQAEQIKQMCPGFGLITLFAFGLFAFKRD